MAKGIPKLNLGFFDDGFKINSKKFHPLNMSLSDIKLESDKEYKSVDPMELLDSFSEMKLEGAAKTDKIKALKGMLGKINP